MKQAINWKKLALEGMVIVSSILLAFTIDAWWDNQREARDERIALQDLEEELKQNISSINRIWLSRHFNYFASSILVHRAIHGLPIDDSSYSQTLSKLRQGSDWRDVLFEFSAREAVEPILQAQLQDAPVEIAALYVNRAGRSATYGPTLASLDVLFQSGSVGRIRDAELRAKLVALPTELKDLSTEENILFDLVHDGIRQALYAASDGNLLVSLLPPSVSNSGYAPKATELFQGGILIRPTKELSYALAQRMDQDLLMLRQLGSVKARYEEILRLMEAY